MSFPAPLLCRPLLLALCLCLPLPAIAAENKATREAPAHDDMPTVGGYADDDVRGAKAAPGQNPEMNGIHFSDYEGFEKTWKLATVTYRTDVKEMRFSYANDKAYQTLLDNSTDYPDGATFIKVAVQTLGDPAFINSEVPQGSHRYQVMLRDRVKYKATDGWGYASFAATKWGYDIYGWDGKIAKDNLYNMQDKCHACHTLVKDRGYIFSKLANINPQHGNDVGEFLKQPKPTATSGVTFKTVVRDSLPEELRQFIPAGFNTLRRVDGLLGKYGYTGNAYEMRMTFIVEALQSHMPVIHYKEDGGSILIVAPTTKEAEPISPTCKAGDTLLVSYWNVGSSLESWPSKDLFCYGEESVPQLLPKK